MAEHFIKLENNQLENENNNKSVFDVDLNMDLNELFRETFGEPIIDMSLSFEETMERFLKDLSGRIWHSGAPK